MLSQVLTTNSPDMLWLTVNPSLQRLDQALLAALAQNIRVSQWAYSQTPDEPSSLDVALTLLHDYVKGHDRPLDLAGHGTGGLLGLLYARRFPHRVRSLTLLAVGVNPAVDWKAHYYAQLERLPCSRTWVLTQMARTLLGRQSTHVLKGWAELLNQDLTQSLSLHSLMKRFSIFPAGAPVPLLICGGQNDAIVDPMQIQGWQSWLKPGDRIWVCPEGRHFFHANQPQATAHEMLKFWATATSTTSVPVYLESIS
ncbi:MAG: alpha/beta fold hydrolase [Leptolyngbyaceae cyanobacterium]